MRYECLWYNGEEGFYEHLDFEPDGMDDETIRKRAWEILRQKYFYDEQFKEKVIESLFLIDVTDLKKL